MQYDRKIVEQMMTDVRWLGTITPEKAQSWKTRGIIPNHYFNAHYVKYMKQGQLELAKQVKDPFFNENFIFQPTLTEAEKTEHDRVLQLLQNEKISITKVLLQTGISLYQYINVIRPNDHRIYLRPDQVEALDNNLQELRIKISIIISKYDKKEEFANEDKKEVDQILLDQRLDKSKLIGNKVVASRVYQRSHNGAIFSEDNEVKFLVERLTLFLRETAQ